jgi:PAS domain S-box-containing protein
MATDRETELLRQQAVLAKFGEFALRSDDLDDILHQACLLVGQACNTRFAKVMEFQSDGVTLLVRAGIGWPEGVVGHVTVTADKTSSEGYAVETGKPVISQDIESEQRFTYPDFLRAAGIRALVNVVILGRDGEPPYGLLQVDSTAPRAFTEADTDFLRSYANLLAAAVNRLRVLIGARRTAEALQHSEHRLRTLMEGIPQLVWRACETGAWTWAGPQWISFTGLSEEQSRGDGWLQAVHPDDRPAALLAWRQAQSEGVLERDLRLRHAASGTYCWFKTRATPLRGPGGGILEWIGTFADIDDQVRAREVLARGREDLEALVVERTAALQQALDTLQRESRERLQAEERLRQSEKLKAIGQLTGGIAHDFNNLLQALTSSLSIIRLRLQQGRTAEIPGYIDRAERSATRAASLTSRLLTFGRRQTLSAEPVSLDRVATGMEDMIRRTVGPAVQVDLKLCDGKWLVMCDPNQMESALLNLCVNARDAMPEGGWLTVSTQELVLSAADLADFEDTAPGRYASIAVSDTGSGMPQDVVAHVFEPFFTTKPLGQGAGLGLSQIYGFVRQSGGIVQIESLPNKGTTVRLCLPFHEYNNEGQDVSAPSTGRTILLVEDEEDVRELTAEQLRTLGYRVLEAQTGAAAIRVVQTGAQIDLLVSDVGLPGGMNGKQVAETVRRHRPGLPVILITGYAGGDPLPGLDVLRKPFDFSLLADAVRARLQA